MTVVAASRPRAEDEPAAGGAPGGLADEAARRKRGQGGAEETAAAGRALTGGGRPLLAQDENDARGGMGEVDLGEGLFGAARDAAAEGGEPYPAQRRLPGLALAQGAGHGIGRAVPCVHLREQLGHVEPLGQPVGRLDLEQPVPQGVDRVHREAPAQPLGRLGVAGLRVRVPVGALRERRVPRGQVDEPHLRSGGPARAGATHSGE